MSIQLQPFLKKRFEPNVFTGLPLTIFIIVFLIILATFIGLTDSIVNSQPIVTFDNNFAQTLYHLRTPTGIKVFYTITNFADQITIAILLAISLVYLYFKKEMAYLYALVITFIGAEGSAFLIKILINRARPGADIAYYLETSKSFPSGHSTVAMAFFGFVTYYIIHHSSGRSKKSLFILLGSILIGLIGFSRLYLGEHYLSDVLGGFLVGGLWLIVGITFRERHFYVSSLKAKIEKEVEKAKSEINKIIKEKGEQAAFECGVLNLDPRIISILGRLYFRTSYGQNVLQHSVEMAHIAGMIAEELGANVNVAKAGALVHDIGKAVDHEVAGTHVEIGRRILQKFGAHEDIIKAMQAHHEEYPYETIESYIVQTADAISGGRPGARRDSVENYLKRLGDLEAIANSFKGVERAYALQAGREVRVFVFPTEVTDLEAKTMARDIAVRIENDLKYPGEIKVNVIRELRAIEFAR